MIDTLYRFPAKVLRVVDGDTVVVKFTLLPVEEHQYPRQEITHKLRFLGVDTAELKSQDATLKKYAYTAKDFTTKELLNEEIILQVTGQDAFGRILGKVFHEGKDFNAVLIQEGYAQVYKR